MNATCVLSAASAAFSGHFHFFFLFLGFCRFLFRGTLVCYYTFFFSGRGFFLSAHGTVFFAASATAAWLVSSQGASGAADKTGSCQQAGNANPCQKFFQIPCFHKTLLQLLAY
ncbi:MAG: hypothetical protein A2505_06785 [Deltaproteobacteria bacterium RIFOXYD12_FULL_55_16]|nr:MAG: hypothetical protein A2505_06785 [Deltaproteobacteria bacterium RIFOXYD12_FULL_55_16]